jgi:hypothetical protein
MQEMKIEERKEANETVRGRLSLSFEHIIIENKAKLLLMSLFFILLENLIF